MGKEKSNTLYADLNYIKKTEKQLWYMYFCNSKEGKRSIWRKKMSRRRNIDVSGEYIVLWVFAYEIRDKWNKCYVLKIDVNG